MKKVIGIYCGEMTYNTGQKWDSDIIRREPCGGSETWAVELSSQFKKLGFHVIVFCNCENWHFDSEGVEYVPFWLYKSRCEYQYFDYFIASRVINGFIDELECPNIYIMCHERGIFDRYWGNFASYEQLQMGRVKKIAVLSEWNKDETKKFYPQIPDDKYMITFNGVNDKLYQDVDVNKKKNMMLWSSCLNRGMTFFGRHVINKIKEAVPDFELYICSYNVDIHGEIPTGDWIHFMGPMRKEDMSKLQKESKLWILPNYGFDDFGRTLQESCPLTAIENMLAKNAIICFNKGGTKTVMDGYDGMVNIDYIDEVNCPSEEELDKLGTLVAEIAIKILTDDEYRLRLVKSEEKICDKYTWKNSAMTWLKEWGLIYNE